MSLYPSKSITMAYFSGKMSIGSPYKTWILQDRSLTVRCCHFIIMEDTNQEVVKQLTFARHDVFLQKFLSKEMTSIDGIPKSFYSWDSRLLAKTDWPQEVVVELRLRLIFLRNFTYIYIHCPKAFQPDYWVLLIGSAMSIQITII